MMCIDRLESRPEAGRHRLLTPDELAELLGVATRTVRRLTLDGTIPHIQVGGRRPRYVRDEVLAALRGTNNTGDGR